MPRLANGNLVELKAFVMHFRNGLGLDRRVQRDTYKNLTFGESTLESLLRIVCRNRRDGLENIFVVDNQLAKSLGSGRYSFSCRPLTIHPSQLVGDQRPKHQGTAAKGIGGGLLSCPQPRPCHPKDHLQLSNQ